MYDIHTDTNTHAHIFLEKMCAFMHVVLKQNSSRRCLTRNGFIKEMFSVGS